MRRFVEVYVDCSLAELRRRDPKGLYRRDDAGDVPQFTGVSDPYEAPLAPEVHVDTEHLSVDQSVAIIVEYLTAQCLIGPATSFTRLCCSLRPPRAGEARPRSAPC